MSVSTETRLDVLAEHELQNLIEGNRRFVTGEAHFPTVCKDVLAELARGQHPSATILGCSDSRVPPELIFDTHFGELFIVRIAGNIVSSEVKGSLEYAGAHLRTPLFVVLGHENCGAVDAAVQSMMEGSQHAAHIQILVDNILAGLPDLTYIEESDRLSRAVEANVRWSMHEIESTAEWSNARQIGAKLVGAVYQITTGEVRFLEA